ncbi:MAG: flavodoxin domain-containing protein [Acholeplasmataceae bacterium]|jgi:flavodoxin|nr:flavodoxin domain-containing protein [Acholeplasmataceae bacterium]
MKELIVFYSKTGNTRSIAERIKKVLTCETDEIKALSDDPNQTYVELTHAPDLNHYPHIIFGSPVHGFTLPKVTKAYLDGLNDLDGKTFDLFVTHFFPFAWMGGNQVLKQMKKIIESKHGEVKMMTSINWKSKKRDRVIEDMLKAYQS